MILKHHGDFTLYVKIPQEPLVCLLQNNIGIRMNSPHVGSLTRQDGQKEVLHDSDNTMSPLNILVTQPVPPDNSVKCSTHGTDLLWTRRQNLNQHHLLLPLLWTQTHTSKYGFIMFRFRLLHPGQSKSCITKCNLANGNLNNKTISHPGLFLVPFVSDMPVSMRQSFQENITQITGVKCTGVVVGPLNQFCNRSKVQTSDVRNNYTNTDVLVSASGRKQVKCCVT